MDVHHCALALKVMLTSRYNPILAGNYAQLWVGRRERYALADAVLVRARARRIAVLHDYRARGRRVSEKPCESCDEAPRLDKVKWHIGCDDVLKAHVVRALGR